MHLNADQQSVVDHILGPLLVLAPAGSGKTALLALRAVRALQAGINPEGMLCLTFTNLAARQLRDRVERILPQYARHIWTGTFHGFCASVLHIEAKHVGLPGDFVIYDEEDCKELLTFVMKRDGWDGIGKPDDLLTIFDNAKARAQGSAIRLHGYDGQGITDQEQRTLYLSYARELIARHALDFSDLIYFVRAMFEHVDPLRWKWSGRFKFIQVDEVQDTHLAEYDVIRTLSSAKSIAFFGDLDQSIYGWRGATPIRVRDQFIEDFQPVIRNLPLNYRATKSLIRAADTFASRAFSMRSTKLVPDESCPNGLPIKVHHADSEDAEATWIGRQIQVLTRASNCSYRDIAVLCRTNKKAQQIGSALESLGMPCLTVEQYQFFRRQEVKDAVCFLKLLLNPHDISAAHRIALRYIENVGAATVRRIAGDGSRIGLRLPDFLRTETFNYDDPFGELIHAYSRKMLTVVDTETTGLSPFSDNVVELAYCILVSGHATAERSALIRSNKPVGVSLHVHGISDEKLEQEGVAPEHAFAAMLQDSAGSLVVGHNVAFDLAIIRSHAARVGIEIPIASYVDTYEIARRFISCDSYRLGDLCEILHLPHGTAHRALGDVKATVALLRALMPRIEAGQAERRVFVAKYRGVFESFADRFSYFRREVGQRRPALLLDTLLSELGVLDAYREEPHRTENLRRLVSIFSERDPIHLPPSDALQVLVQFSSLAKNLDHLSESADKVIVAPIHQSKGLEFKSVFIAGAVDGFIPVFRASDVEEEKRLFYVAMTRARNALHVTGFRQYVTDRGYVFEKTMTPFLRHIDPAFLDEC
jgi:DNA helicase-2/ATP-dependent DNA helicase PcrA